MTYDLHSSTEAILEALCEKLGKAYGTDWNDPKVRARREARAEETAKFRAKRAKLEAYMRANPNASWKQIKIETGAAKASITKMRNKIKKDNQS